mmetsp:Transcript_72985/g.152404  ORF Transcript_72985/g.152404 Transcript_72985/m.152404 type:complete len:87 (+) Transcript_72985:1008-1268(+)
MPGSAQHFEALQSAFRVIEQGGGVVVVLVNVAVMVVCTASTTTTLVVVVVVGGVPGVLAPIVRQDQTSRSELVQVGRQADHVECFS